MQQARYLFFPVPFLLQSPLYHLERRGDEVQRCAEIVRYVCEEHQLGVGGFLKLPCHCEQLPVLLYQLVLMLVEALV